MPSLFEDSESNTEQSSPMLAAPRLLVELEVPGKTGPVPSGEWGINIAAARENFPREGLQVYVPAWPQMGRGDSVAVLLAGTEITRKTVGADEVGARQTLFIPSNRITDGRTTINYRVTRVGQVPEDSAVTEVLVKLDRPGGQDQNGSLPGHSELKLSLPAQIIKDGVDKEAAAKGVVATIEPYPFMAEYDEIRLTWGGQFVFHTVTESEVGSAIEITVDETTILAAGDSGNDGLAVAFEIYDLVDNKSEDWSAEIRVVVDTGNSRLNAGIVKEARNNTLDLDALGLAPVTLQVIALPPDFEHGDEIIVTLAGTTAEGVAVDIDYPPQAIDNLPHVYEIAVANSDVRRLAKTQGAFKYRLVKSDGSVQHARGQFVTIVGEPTQLAAPIAKDAEQGSLDPLLPFTTIEVPWDESMAAGQVLNLQWYGTRPDDSVYFPELMPHDITNGEASAKLPIEFHVEGKHLQAIEGGGLELYYELINDQGTVRKSLTTARFNIGQPRAELPAPIVKDATGDVLDPGNLPPNGTTLYVKSYTGIAIGDTLYFSWQGSATGNDEDSIRINANNIGRSEFALAISLDKVKDNQGGTVKASYWVQRADGRVSNSDVLRLHIGERQVQLPAPAVAEADAEGVIDPGGVPGGATVVIASAAELAVGDSVRVVLSGKVADEQTHRVTEVGEQHFNLPYAVVKANENSSIELQYHVQRGGREVEESSPIAVFDIRVKVGKGRLKVLGARRNRSNCHSHTSPSYLHAFDAETNLPLQAEWKYTTDERWTLSTRWRDTEPQLLLQVRTADDQVMVNPANVFGNGDINSTSPGESAFVALRDDGSLRAWGHPDTGGVVPDHVKELSDFVEVSCSARACAARRVEGTVVAWGRGSFGGDMGSISPTGFIQTVASGMAIAGLKRSGVRAWAGDNIGWGATVPDDIANRDDIIKLVGGGGGTFAGLLGDGRLVAWGLWDSGGVVPGEVAALNNFVDVKANRFAIAALRGNGELFTWGNSFGGSPGEVPTDIVELCCGNQAAFVAKRASGHLLVWGYSGFAGRLPGNIASMTDIVDVAATTRAFAAVRAGGRVVAWGDHAEGTVSPEVANISDAVQITGSMSAFAVLRRNGTVLAWGEPRSGADIGPVRSELVNVQAVYSNAGGFVALTSDGRVVAWGSKIGGGDNSAHRHELDGFVSYYASPTTRGRALSAQRAIGTAMLKTVSAK
ncbi:hypothetical protein [Pseudomonas sp. DG56-2]|uniref:RCC1 domain-containing protein n=1 Tax=Pseudomonas sp. DG56-2 TaxID=2320270 RepID=UPI0010A5C225|nr:hypothetical protein [Pseudomonas sp. DG56-2]